MQVQRLAKLLVTPLWNIIENKGCGMLILCLHLIVSSSIFNAGHGAGETLRGTINDTLDQFGKGITQGGSQDTGATQHTASGENHASTVEKGKQEFNQGVSDLSNTGK